MVGIYVAVDLEGFINGYGLEKYGIITKLAKDSHLVMIPENSDFFNEYTSYKLIDGAIIKDKNKLLSEIKIERIESLSSNCREAILGGFEVGFMSGIYRFSYDKEAQLNLSERWQLFQNDMISSIKITCHDLNNNSKRLTFDKKQFNELYIASVQHKENCIGHYRDELVPLIESAQTLGEVEAIKWETQVVNPAPKPIVINDDDTIAKKIDVVKMDQAEGSAELINLIMMMGGM